MHIGLIVGIGPAATDYYYRSLIGRMAAAHSDLELTMAHADTPTLLANQAAEDTQGQVAIYDHLTRRLQAAGACCVAVTSIAGHFCIEAFERVSSLPVINLLSVVNDGVQAPATGSPLCRGEPLSDGLPRGGRRPVRASTPLVRLLIRGLASRRRGASSPRSAPRRPARLVAVKAEVPGRGRRIRVR